MLIKIIHLLKRIFMYTEIEKLKQILKDKKIAFFFGAGVSLVNGVPKKLCEGDFLNCLQCHEIFKKVNNGYIKGTDGQWNDDDFYAFQYVIREATSIAKKCFKCKYPELKILGSFYEEVVDIIQECSLVDSNTGSFYNTDYRLLGRVLEFKTRSPEYWESKRKNGDDDITVAHRICNLTMMYIEKFLLEVLYTDYSTNVKGFQLLRDFLKIKPNLSIYTLNHDLLVEDVLVSEGKKEYVNNIKRGEYEDVLLYKLHNSIADIAGVRYNRGALLEKYKEISFSNIKTGTDTKSLFYRGSNSEVIENFRKDLSSCDILFLSGFGFNDIKMVEFLNEWISVKSKNRLLIRMYEKGSFEKTNMKASYVCSVKNSEVIKPMRMPLELNGKVVDTGKFMSDTTLEDLIKIFENEQVQNYLKSQL